MKKIKDNISNHSKTSRDYSSLISSSNDSESEKQLQKTLGNFSESYIKTLSKKLNEKAAERTPPEKETRTMNDKQEDSLPILMKVRSDPAFKTNQQNNNDSPSDQNDQEINPLFNQVLQGSRETTKKEASMYENDLEGEKDPHTEVYFFFLYYRILGFRGGIKESKRASTFLNTKERKILSPLLTTSFNNNIFFYLLTTSRKKISWKLMKIIFF